MRENPDGFHSAFFIHHSALATAKSYRFANAAWRLLA